MASKQLGKFRQWAGEVISSKEKTTVAEEFRELERDIVLRKDGMHRLTVASEAYHHYLSKKKANEVLGEAEKLLPIDTLGIVMILHGEDFGEESSYGASLVKLGRAHCKVATLQEAFALTFKDTFLASIERFKEEIKEYEVLRKKLDSRRLSYDAAISKLEKVSKSNRKEKEKREAEDEMDRAKQRYEETAEDLRAHMHAIQENEFSQLKDLGSFLDLEINFVQHYFDVLREVKSEWPEKSSTSYLQTFPSVRNINPSPSRLNHQSVRVSPDLSSDDEPYGKRRRSGSTASKTPSNSRPASRLSRKRTNSTSASTMMTPDLQKDSAKPHSSADKEKEKNRRMSVTGWASSAVESVTSRGKKSKDTEAFSALGDDDDEPSPRSLGEGSSLKNSSSFRSLGRRPPSRNKSIENVPGVSPKATPRILRPPSAQERKVVRALYDFSGSSDELSFKAGSEILVLNEVLDDWWLGELEGRSGLFPTTYVETLSISASTPQRAATTTSKNSNGLSLLVPSSAFGPGSGGEEEYPSDMDDEFGVQPMMVQRSPFYGAFNDALSVTSSQAEEEQEEQLPQLDRPLPAPQQKQAQTALDDEGYYAPKPKAKSILHSLDTAQQPLINRSISEGPPDTISGRTLFNVTQVTAPSIKKTPPPPPPRRHTTIAVSSVGPPIPERRLPPFASKTSVTTTSTPASSMSGHGYDTSPFESVSEDSGCGKFRQNPFKPKGMCSNCLEFHD